MFIDGTGWVMEICHFGRVINPFSTPDLYCARSELFNMRHAEAIAIICDKESSSKLYVTALFYTDYPIRNKKRYIITLNDIVCNGFYTVGRGIKDCRTAWLKYCSLLGEAAYKGYLIDGQGKYFHTNRKNKMEHAALFDVKNIQFVPYSTPIYENKVRDVKSS